MITSTQQRNLTVKAIERLEQQLVAKPVVGAPEVLLKANRARTREQITELRAAIVAYDAACNANLHKLKFESFEELQRAPIILRLANNMSIDKFATVVGISERQITRYEQEEYLNAPGDIVRKILSAFGVKITAKTAAA